MDNIYYKYKCFCSRYYKLSYHSDSSPMYTQYNWQEIFYIFSHIYIYTAAMVLLYYSANDVNKHWNICNISIFLI